MKYSILIIFLLSTVVAFGQAGQNLLHSGTIQWERKTNIHAYLDDMSKNGNASFLERNKQNADKYKIDKFVMEFNKEESVYQPAPDGISESQVRWLARPAQENTVYNNYSTKSTVAAKEIYDKSIIVKDSLSKYKWKIKEEFRTIAGFSCRRAETIIMDSIWVVAFYTDAIIAPGGPESFNGLPGMILGVVMPRLNVTYFATDVAVYFDKAREMDVPQKGKEYTKKGLAEYLSGSMKQWGDRVQAILWYSNI